MPIQPEPDDVLGVGDNAYARRCQWLEANQAAFESWKRDLSENGLPLDAYCQF